MARFTLPRDLYFGKGAMEELRTALAGYKKGCIVVGACHSMQKNGFLAKLENILHEAGLETQVFEGVEPDPSVETVMRGAQAMRDFQPDVIRFHRRRFPHGRSQGDVGVLRASRKDL